MSVAKAALVLVIFVDIMGQGLAFPIFSVLLLSDQATMLAAGTPASTRQLLYGVLIGLFFLSWFLGAIYVSRISDSIGRKRGIMLCLAGSLAGYVLAVIAVVTENFWLLVLSRVVTGFTAGSQPIAQAALVDLSTDEADRTRNMGLVMLGAGIGLVGGPIVGGVFSLGVFGSLALIMPFVAGGVIIALTMAVIAASFEETITTRVPLNIHPAAVFTLIWEITKRPVVARISLAYVPYMLSFFAFYVFFDNALEQWFGFDTTGQSAGMFVMGIAIAITSTVLLPKVMGLAVPRTLMVGLIVLEITATLTFVGFEMQAVAFVCIAVMGFVHASMYPTFLKLFSGSVSDEDQGWVMGVTISLFTLSSGIAALVGGLIGAANFDAMFFFGAGSSLMALLAIALVWRTGRVHELATTR
ncbi:MAG: MFS transporter [Pseudomonadota bacterium]